MHAKIGPFPAADHSNIASRGFVRLSRCIGGLKKFHRVAADQPFTPLVACNRALPVPRVAGGNGLLPGQAGTVANTGHLAQTSREQTAFVCPHLTSSNKRLWQHRRRMRVAACATCVDPVGDPTRIPNLCDIMTRFLQGILIVHGPRKLLACFASLGRRGCVGDRYDHIAGWRLLDGLCLATRRE
jgi:hypothetical protein